jgi:hypothetical protein
MKRFLHDNGLSIVLLAVFLLFLAGQAVTGYYQHNEERSDHGAAPIGFRAYLASGDFLEATAENWESEFLQIAGYVILTVFLFQRGSAESKKPDRKEPVDRRPAKHRSDAPWPVRRGGWVLKVYENSLSLAFVLLFLISFFMHALAGRLAFNEEQLEHGGHAATLAEFMHSPEFWFQSFQNWQSEFLGIAAMVLLSIWLRQKGSPESKKVDAPHGATGKDE